MQHSANRGLGGLAVHPGDGLLSLPVCLLVLGDRSSAFCPFISIKFLFLVFFFFFLVLPQPLRALLACSTRGPYDSQQSTKLRRTRSSANSLWKQSGPGTLKHWKPMINSVAAEGPRREEEHEILKNSCRILYQKCFYASNIKHPVEKNSGHQSL